MPSTSTMPQGPAPTHFSTHFKLAGTQSQFEFVNIPLDTDAPLFVDPYSFKVNHDLWSVECNNLLVDFFQRLLDEIRAGRIDEANNLLRPLREPNATRLGLSQGRPRGRGMGPIHSSALVQHLRSSTAFKTGLLHDLSDCELMIPHVSNDRISDITSNVVMAKLAEFTKQQCEIYGIPTSNLAIGPTWNPDAGFWKSVFGDLPSYRGMPIVLVPKTIVRRKMTFDHEEYWRHHVLPYLQQEHMNSNSALVRMLKGGKRALPTKKSLAAVMPCDKNALSEFSNENPPVLKKYRNEVTEKRPSKLTDTEISESIGEVVQFRLDPSSPGVRVTVNNFHIHGDVNNSTIGGGAINARDISSFKQQLASIQDESTRNALINARERIEAADIGPGDRTDAADALGQLATEIQKPEPDRSRLSKWLGRLNSTVPAAVTVLGAIKAVADVIKLMAT